MFRWTNASVIAFAGDVDPVQAMENKARQLTLKAMDEGWGGPPFDPLALAEWNKMRIVARDDIPDARTVPTKDGLQLEFNPLRPHGRLRFSIAHEIAHSLFPDCAKEIRNRGKTSAVKNDHWQLEALCNIGAAELLMPLGSFSQLAKENLSIKSVLELRKQFEVSVEACLIRLVKLSQQPCAAFCASTHDDGHYHIDYVIPAAGWNCPIKVGQKIPATSVINEANAIGFTALGDEEWAAKHPIRIECVGLAPYPESVVPRVVGLVLERSKSSFKSPTITELAGDALQPRGDDHRIIAHVIPDTSSAWGGGGFASQVKRRLPNVWSQFKSKTFEIGAPPKLGSIYFDAIDNKLGIAHMVAQHGIGATNKGPRLRYAALSDCLSALRKQAKGLDASVHMPRIGTGHGGASWEIIRELITQELVEHGVRTTIYTLPN